MDFRLRKQLDEAFGSVNRWFCAQAHGRRVDDKNALLEYFIKTGGAEDFAIRFDEAMSELNRWFCSEFHGREIRDPEVLWNYYVNYRLAGPGENATRGRPREDDGSSWGMAG